jgi:hypothetical protein
LQSSWRGHLNLPGLTGARSQGAAACVGHRRLETVFFELDRRSITWPIADVRAWLLKYQLL